MLGHHCKEDRSGPRTAASFVLLAAVCFPAHAQRFEFGAIPALHLPMASDAGAYRMEAEPPQDPPTVAPIRYKATFMPQGSESIKALTTKVIPGVGVLLVSICDRSGAGQQLHIGHIQEVAAEKGISLLDKRVGVYLVERTVQKNWRKITIDILRHSAMIGASLTVPGVIAANTAVQTGLVYFGIVGERVSSGLRERLPDLKWTDAILDGDLRVPANSCSSGLVLWRYSPHMTVAVAEVR